MREIKFRIWDEKYLTFEFNDSPELFISTEGEVYEKDTVNFSMQTYDEYNKADHYKISQYTGLKDKNGREIYEGDIVKYTNWNPKEVIYDGGNGFMGFRYKNTDCFLMGYDSEKVEVIGNKYENPNLIEGEQDGLPHGS